MLGRKAIRFDEARSIAKIDRYGMDPEACHALRARTTNALMSRKKSGGLTHESLDAIHFSLKEGEAHNGIDNLSDTAR